MSFSPSTSDLTQADKTVLRNLHYDIRNDIRDSSKAEHKEGEKHEDHDDNVKPFLEENSHEGWVFTMWEKEELHPLVDKYIAQPYLNFAQSLVRQNPDAVFITHIAVHFSILLPSAIYLFYDFHWIHAIAHTIFAVWNAGPFTLMLHNHIHNNGILRKPYALVDKFFPYITGPLMGHTWDSYYNHHVKMHHVEGNGPADLSTTIYYQRDEVTEFLKYLFSFLLFSWIQLPHYFYKNKKYQLAVKTFVQEISCLGLILYLTYINTRPAVFTLVLPLLVMRIGMMVGNWGQHCLVDNVEPMSDFRSSITLIDVSSNRHCFNDGYHTSHHLNPRRHWKAHPAAFLAAKHKYQTEGALTFANIDYIMITLSCITKNFDRLAEALVPMGDQIGMSHEEKVEMLRSKTRKFTAEEIKDKFMKGAKHGKAPVPVVPLVEGENELVSVQEEVDVLMDIQDVKARPNMKERRRGSIGLVAEKAKEVIGESSGIKLVNPDLLSQRI